MGAQTLFLTSRRLLLVVSSSNVRRWTKGKTVEVLKGHDGAVHVVQVLPSGEVVTGVSDVSP